MQRLRVQMFDNNEHQIGDLGFRVESTDGCRLFRGSSKYMHVHYFHTYKWLLINLAPLVHSDELLQGQHHFTRHAVGVAAVQGGCQNTGRAVLLVWRALSGRPRADAGPLPRCAFIRGCNTPGCSLTPFPLHLPSRFVYY